MSKKIYKECQHITRPEVYFLLGLFSVLLVKEWVQYIWSSSGNLILLIVLTFLFGAMWWLILNLVLRIKIGKRRITVQYKPILAKKHKIDLEDIESFEFYEIPESALWSGWGVRYFTNHHFSLGDNAGLRITLEDGEQYIISSSKLLTEKDKIEPLLNISN